MGKPTGFKEFDRKKVEWRLPVVRLNDYGEIYTEPDEQQLRTQGLDAWTAGFLFANRQQVAL